MPWRGSRRRWWSGLLAVAVAACSGGGGGSGPGTAATVDPRIYETEEYRANHGLGAIGAAAAYADGATGRGVTVAVIDTGIDVHHPEFAGAIHPAATDIVPGDRAELQDGHGHGTAVAGVIGARRNNVATHGVAFDSILLPIRADSPGSCPAGCLFTQDAVADATAYAVASGARVINYSLGGASALAPSLRNALADAAAKGTVLVLAAGNDEAADPTYPARFAGETGAAGAAVAVGAVDEDNVLAWFSNRAGNTRDAFLVAPGTGITAPKLGGGTASWNGTSFSAPHVAGAAAVLIGHAPHLSGPQVVELLLGTAIDLGDPGTDAVYGRGLVNLAAALRPQAPLRVPTGAAVDGPAAPFGATRLRAGAAFGPALGRAPGLSDAILLDRHDRPYRADLARGVTPAPNAVDLGRWLAMPARVRSASAAGGALGLNLVTAEGGRFADDLTPWRDGSPGRTLGLTATGRLDQATRFTVGRGLALGTAFGPGGSDGAAAFGGLLGRDALVAPFAALTDGGDGLTVERALGHGLALRVGIAADRAVAWRAGQDIERAAYLAELRHRAAGGAELRLRIGGLRERGSLLDAAGEGALALGDGARTRFVGLSGRLPASPRVDLLAHATLGETDPDGGADGAVRDLSTLRSVAFGGGVMVRDAVRTGDRLGLVVSRPLKVVAGRATVDVPVARTLDGRIVRRTRRASLVPEGDEVDLEVSYRLDLAESGTLGLNLLTRIEPGHDEAAAPEVVAGLRYRRRF